MEFIDLKRQYEVIRDKIDDGINKVINNHSFIMGPEVFELEKKLADFVGRKYCLTCGSGTEALQIPLMAYNLCKEDAVFVPSFTFFASAETINLVGATPVFVDVDDSYNISIDSLEREINRVLEEGKLRPRGIISVDLFGRSANYDMIIPLAKKYGLFVLEDAAQGLGGSLHGKMNGSFGDVSATSFFPAKPLGCYGDGGAIFTDDVNLFNLMRSIRIHGMGTNRYDNVRIGINGRLDTIQAAVLLAKLTIFRDELLAREKIAELYISELKGLLKLPRTDLEYFSAWAQFTVRANNEEERTRIIKGMKENEIPIMVYYPRPLHEQEVYKQLGYEKIYLPFCSQITKQVFSLPMHPYLTKDEVICICDTLKKFI